MTFQPAKPRESPAAASTPIEPAADAIESIGDSVDAARENVQAAREQALDAAQSQGERDAVNARFDDLAANVNEMGNRIEAAITSGNAQLAGTLTGFLDRLDARLPGGGQGDTTGDEDDDDILSIEEVLDDVTDPIVGAAAATGEAIQQEVDKTPDRVHRFFRPLWGGNKDD